MPRLIDANEAIKAILYVRDNDLHSGYPRSFEQGAIRKALRCIEETPTIEAEIVRHGRVIVHDGFEDEYYEYCSECKSRDVHIGDNYCPNCGSKLHGGANDVSD